MDHTEVLCLSSEAMVDHHRFLLTSCSHCIVKIPVTIEFSSITIVFLFDHLNHLIFLARDVTYILPFMLFLLIFMTSMLISFVAFLGCCGAASDLFNLALLLENCFLITFVQLIKRYKSHLTLLEFTGIYTLLARIS